MKQDDVINIYELIRRVPGYEDIPFLVQKILYINRDPKSLVQFSLHLKPEVEVEYGERTLYVGQPEKTALTDAHSLQPHREELISDVTLTRKIHVCI